MLKFNPAGKAGRPLTVLCLGAHSDDIEIGCGGTLMTIAAQAPCTEFHWVVFSANPVRRAEAERAARLFSQGGILKSTRVWDFRDGFLPYVWSDVKQIFEELKAQVSPDLVFTQYRRDAHQDHRLLSELAWNTFRDHLILEYEIPKWDGDMGAPNVFVPLETEVCDHKARTIVSVFESQQDKPWFEEETFRSLMRLRGMECNSPSGYAEAFYSRKLRLFG